MRKTLALLLLLAACDRSGAPEGGGNAAAPAASGTESGSAKGPSTPAARDRLAGLYEGGAGEQKNQLCLVEKGGETQFGLIVWGGNLHSCSGAGRATRSGDRLTLTMTGDETCTISASLEDGKISLPATLPTGCAYYCGARANMGGASFARVGDDVKKATDIAGDPLCD